MTIIIAKLLNNKEISIFSDTKLSRGKEEILRQEKKPFEEKYSFQLKSIKLNRSTVVCFAGNSGFAKEGFQSWNNAFSLEETIKHFFDSHISSKKETDYIVASLGQEAKLYRISSGNTIKCSDITHIGNSNFYSNFMKNEFSKSNFIDCLSGYSFGDVGGFSIIIKTINGNFVYEEFQSKTNSIVANKNTCLDIDLINIRNGSYGYTIWPSRHIDQGSVCVYIHEIKRAYMLDPIRYWSPIDVTNICSIYENYNFWFTENYEKSVLVGGIPWSPQ